MPLIPLPSTSYPVDTNLIYEIIRGINVLSDAVAKTAGTSILQEKTIPTNAIQTVTNTISVVNNQNVQAGEVRYFTFDYTDFADIPTVVATPVVTGSNIVTRNLSVVLTSITSSKAMGFIRFAEGGVTTVAISLIAVGVSPTYKR